MYQHMKGDYRMIGRSLYQKQGDAYVHIAIVPPRVKGIDAAIAWYERGEWGPAEPLPRAARRARPAGSGRDRA